MERTALKSIKNVTDTDKFKPFCADCNASFSSKSSLNRHKKDIHENEPRFPCILCDHSFKRSEHLKSHLLSHTGDKPLMCEFCSKRFADASHLKRHQRSHKEEKPFSCPICEKGFAHSKTQLKNHLMTHTGERPFVCRKCCKGFITKIQLTRHFKKCSPILSSLTQS